MAISKQHIEKIHANADLHIQFTLCDTLPEAFTKNYSYLNIKVEKVYSNSSKIQSLKVGQTMLALIPTFSSNDEPIISGMHYGTDFFKTVKNFEAFFYMRQNYLTLPSHEIKPILE